MNLALLAILALLQACALSLPTENLNDAIFASDRKSTMFNVSRGGPQIPERFTIESLAAKINLDEISTYTNIINLMTIQAQENFLGYIPVAAQTFRLPAPYDNVNITFEGIDGRPIQRRFLIYGLYMSIQHFTQTRLWWTVFTLIWDNQHVGVLAIKPYPVPPAPPLTGNTTARNNSNLQVLDGLSRVGPELSVDVNFAPRAAELGTKREYIMLASGLIHFAGANTQARVISFLCGEEYERVILKFCLPVVRRIGYLSNGHGALVLWEIAKFLAREEQFMEVKAQVKLDSRLAATVTLLDYDTPSNDAAAGEVPTS